MDVVDGSQGGDGNAYLSVHSAGGGQPGPGYMEVTIGGEAATFAPPPAAVVADPQALVGWLNKRDSVAYQTSVQCVSHRARRHARDVPCSHPAPFPLGVPPHRVNKRASMKLGGSMKALAEAGGVGWTYHSP